MKPADVTALYDPEYADQYEEHFIFSPLTSFSTEIELGILRHLITPESRWLDVACGTGYFLSQFPEIERAGLDLSPAMLAKASAASPGVEFQQGDYRAAVPKWNRRWSLVSCMWAAYSYVDSMSEVQGLISNLTDWTAEGGTLFLPTIDLEDLNRFDVPFHYSDIYKGDLWITGHTWSWRDGFSGRLHEHLVAPHVAQIVEWLAPAFDRIRVVRYPAPGAEWERKAVIAEGRRAVVQPDKPADVTWEPAPKSLAADPAAALAAFPTRLLLRTLLDRARRRLRKRGSMSKPQATAASA